MIPKGRSALRVMSTLPGVQVVTGIDHW